MSKLRDFTVRAEVEDRWECNRTPARPSSLPVGSDHQCDVRGNGNQMTTPHIVRLIGRYVSPSTPVVFVVNMFFAAVSSPVPSSHL